MDGLTLAAAALAIAVDESRDAALRQAMLERERLAMGVEDRDSFLAQRFFVASMQLRAAGQPRPQTWQAAYQVRDDNFEVVMDALRQVAEANSRGDDQAIRNVVADVLGDEESQLGDEESQPAESSSSDEASEEERAPPPILHRCASCGRMTSSVFLQLPAGRWANLPMDQRVLCNSCEAAE